MKDRLIKMVFFGLFVRPIVFIILGLNIHGREKLPKNGPAVLAANHNSHLDTLVLMSLFPLSKIHKIRPVAAADYFLKNRFLAWFSLTCLGIIPLDRSGNTDKNKLFSACYKALKTRDILIIFPEGSRGSPEQLSTIKKGLFHLVDDHAEIQVTPVVLHGLGVALPRGEALFVPFNCDVVIGEPLAQTKNAAEYVKNIENIFTELRKFCLTR